MACWKRAHAWLWQVGEAFVELRFVDACLKSWVLSLRNNSQDVMLVELRAYVDPP